MQREKADELRAIKPYAALAGNTNEEVTATDRSQDGNTNIVSNNVLYNGNNPGGGTHGTAVYERNEDYENLDKQRD